jgi:hypothetical protein
MEKGTEHGLRDQYGVDDSEGEGAMPNFILHSIKSSRRLFQ